MAFFNNKKIEMTSESISKIDCILDVDTVFLGELESNGSVIINGCLKGKKLIARGNLVIGETGKVEVNSLKVNNVKVSGQILGNVTAKNKIEITEKGKIFGNIHSQRLQIIEGGIFEGTCSMSVVVEEIKPTLELENVVSINK